MNVWPLRFTDTNDGELLFTDYAGGYFRSTQEFLDRYATGELTTSDQNFLSDRGHAFEKVSDLSFIGFASRWSGRLNANKDINYIILVPTLRCNLSCDYCQVSRVNENAKGFDWDDKTLSAVLRLLEGFGTKEIKVEFQGGEPLLRLNMLREVRSFCRSHFETAQFVVCTNLQTVSKYAWDFLSDEDTHISTSLDGTFDVHQQQRTKDNTTTGTFRTNILKAIETKGVGNVSALPTIDPLSAPEPKILIQTFADLGLHSIFLRPINYQGFARKRYQFDQVNQFWSGYYRRFIDELIEYNATADEPFEEYYLTHILRRIIQGGHNNHVDLRNPNWLGQDYLVVDFNGVLYPTDEARMITRIGQLDLSIGNVHSGLDLSKLDVLNSDASNFFDPDCMNCAYQPYCGVDHIDDLSRYGRVDIPRHLTDHCQKHMSLFDLAFELLYSGDPKVHNSLAAWLNIPGYSPHLTPVHL